MRRLVSAGLLPERAGQPVKAVVHISLADLMRLEGSSALLQEWTSRVRAQWAGHRARASAGGGAAARGWTATPPRPSRVMRRWSRSSPGRCNPGALEDLVRLCVQLDRLRHHPRGHAGDAARTARTPATARRSQAAAASDTALAWEALERAIIGKAVDLLSGPGGLASFLRRRKARCRSTGT